MFDIEEAKLPPPRPDRKARSWNTHNGVSWSSSAIPVPAAGMISSAVTGLPVEAMFAVSGGCSNQAALESITIVPARMMGLADRLGSIERGKDADLVLFDGDPFEYTSRVQAVIIDGRVTAGETH